ncbi:MAG: hypothetical protein DLM73_07175 [Chthoniobacterales bacterium]|nr:MAG: hypothetical protein DLM73_07175 [Chthoniobacterales bacterium]
MAWQAEGRRRSSQAAVIRDRLLVIGKRGKSRGRGNQSGLHERIIAVKAIDAPGGQTSGVE